MKELEISIKILKEDKTELECKLYYFFRNGRVPDDNEYYEMMELLENWSIIKSNIKCVEDIQKTIINNI